MRVLYSTSAARIILAEGFRPASWDKYGMRAAWRMAVVVLVLLVGSVPLRAITPDTLTTIPVVFQTSPPGATVRLLGMQSEDLGVSGQPVRVTFPENRAVTLHFLFRLDGYRDFLLDVSSQELKSSGEEVVYPYDRPLPLTPVSPFTALGHFVHVWRWQMTTGLALFLGVLFGLVLPHRRRLLARTRQLKTLLPAGTSEEDPMLGTTLGRRWLLVRGLGRGGCASVYEAVPLETLEREQSVAIKIMHGAALNQEFKNRFAREVQITKSLNHPCLVRLIDWEQGDIFYLVMELVEGKSLRSCIPRPGLPLAEVVRLMEGVFDAIQYAHELGVVHCDLKPENIMVTQDGRVRVMDFGIATGQSFQRLTTTTDVLGTPGYIAPEQMDGVRNEPRSDQYAMGVILFEMLTGRAPFEEPDPIRRLTLHLTQPPPRVDELCPELPAEVGDVIDRMLAKDPLDRFVSMLQAWDCLARAASRMAT